MTNPIPDGLAQMQRQVAEISDRTEITDLVYRVGVSLDEGRFDDLRSIFSEDATGSTPGGTVQGIDALVAQASRNHSRDQRIQHVITNVLVDLDGDEARVRSSLIVNFAPGPGVSQPHFTLGEVYSFDACRTQHGWQLTRVESKPVWATGSRDAAAPAPAGS
jgi:hypothetical protein